MKKLIAVFAILLINISFAQEERNKPAFSSLQFGVLGGTNFGSFSDKGGSFIAEFNTNLISDLSLNLSLGYSKTFKPESYIVKTYYTVEINGTQHYWSDLHTETQKEYDIFPVSLGASYVFKNSTISPYLVIAASYNFISGKTVQAGGYSAMYNSYNDLPKEYQQVYKPNLPNHSFGLSLGAGILYPLSSKINLEFRYLYKMDSEIINTNNIVVGISF